jgi:hypothetical protein
VLPRSASVALTAMMLTLLPAGSASAAASRKLCFERTVLRDSPGGFVIGHLVRPQTLLVLLHDVSDGWSYVRVKTGTQGWVASRALCKTKNKKGH